MSNARVALGLYVNSEADVKIAVSIDQPELVDGRPGVMFSVEAAAKLTQGLLAMVQRAAAIQASFTPEARAELARGFVAMQEALCDDLAQEILRELSTDTTRTVN